MKYEIEIIILWWAIRKWARCEKKEVIEARILQYTRRQVNEDTKQTDSKLQKKIELNSYVFVVCVLRQCVCEWVGVCVADWCSIFSFIHLFSDSINLSIFHRVFCDFQSIWRRKEIFIDVDRNRGGSWLCFFAAEIHLFSSFLAAARLLLPNREKWFGLMRQHWASRVAALPCAR